MLTLDVACSFPFACLRVEAYLGTINRPEINRLDFLLGNSSELAVFQDLYVSDVPEDLELHSEILPEGAPKKNAEMMLFALVSRERERDVDSANC